MTCAIVVFLMPICSLLSLCFFFFNDTATTEIYTLSLHDALPIYPSASTWPASVCSSGGTASSRSWGGRSPVGFSFTPLRARGFPDFVTGRLRAVGMAAASYRLPRASASGGRIWCAGMLGARGLPPTYWILWTGALINRLGGFVMPLLALYLTGERGLSVEQAGLVVSLYGAGALLSGPLGGFFADHSGRRRTLVAGLVLGALAMLHLAFARTALHIGAAAFLLGLFG